MCKVSIYSNNKGFILTSSRDISNKREHSLPPKISTINNIKIISPIDPQGKGSWIGASYNLAACLLNHDGKNSPKSISRGLLLIKLLSKQINIEDIEKVCKDYNPFNLLLINIKSNFINQHIWDGQKYQKLEILENQKIFLSNSIYSSEEIEYYNNNFNSLDYNNLTADKIYNFHVSQNNLYNLKDKKTTSITQISNIDKISIKYIDMLKHSIYRSNL